MRFIFTKCILFLITALLLSSCSFLKQSTQIQKPKVVDWKVKLTGLSFDAVSLDYKMKLANPNPIGVNLKNYSYDVLVEDRSLVKGNQQNGIRLGAKDSSWVSIPLTFTYQELYQAGKSYISSDSVKLAFKTDFGLDIPVIGLVQIPFESHYSIPVMKRPNISLADFKIESISLTGAKFNLKLSVDNPNMLSIDLGKVGFDLKINGKSWLKSALDKVSSLKAKSITSFDIPISISLSDIGVSVLNAIKSGKPFDYEIDGNAEVKLPLFDSDFFSLPFTKKGNLSIK